MTDDDRAGCACLGVVYDPIKNADGTLSERWHCTSCGARFVRDRGADDTRELREAAECAAEMDRAAAAIESDFPRGLDRVRLVDGNRKIARTIRALLDRLARAEAALEIERRRVEHWRRENADAAETAAALRRATEPPDA